MKQKKHYCPHTYSDPRIQGAFCAECWPDVLESHTRTCVHCGKEYILYQIFTRMGESLCPLCEIGTTNRERRLVAANNKRAQEVELPATLTVTEWLDTIRHFEGMCAYCLVRPYREMDHFIPLHLEDSSTSKSNCVPACQSCNTRKRGTHPDELCRIPTSAIKRIRAYLQQF